MERYGIEYGYRLVARDLPHGDRLGDQFRDERPDEWFRLIRRYVKQHRGGDPGWLLDACYIGSAKSRRGEWELNASKRDPANRRGAQQLEGKLPFASDAFAYAHVRFAMQAPCITAFSPGCGRRATIHLRKLRPDLGRLQ